MPAIIHNDQIGARTSEAVLTLDQLGIPEEYWNQIPAASFDLLGLRRDNRGAMAGRDAAD